jgi:hypothetical protein
MRFAFQDDAWRESMNFALAKRSRECSMQTARLEK